MVSEDKITSAYAAPGIAIKFNKPASGQQSNEEEGDGSSKSDKEKEKEKGKSLFSEGSDEMDSSRMKVI